MLQDLWQFLVGLAICAVGLIILDLDLSASAAHPTIADSGSYFLELGLALALAGGIWAVMQVRRVLGLARPEPSKEKPPQPQPQPAWSASGMRGKPFS